MSDKKDMNSLPLLLRILRFSLYLLFFLGCQSPPDSVKSLTPDNPANRENRGENEPLKEIPAPQESPGTKTAPLNDSQAAVYIRRYSKNGYKTVEDQQHPLWVKYDLDQDSSPDYLVLYVADNSTADLLSELSQYSRLFDAEVFAVPYYLQLFFNRDGTLVPGKWIALGEKKVITYLKTSPINLRAPLPVAVILGFQTDKGSGEEWLILSGQRILSRFSMMNTLSKTIEVKDLDGNGMVDIIQYEKGYEEGFGNETYITWFKWDGQGFKEYRNTNVLRNLRDFLVKLKEDILAKNWPQLLEVALEKGELRRLERQGLSSFEIVDRVFRPLDQEKSINAMLKITDVILPEILEDPFVKEGKTLVCHISLGVVNEHSETAFFDIFVEFKPFDSPQYCLKAD